MARLRRIRSVRDELVRKSREAAIAAVQIFNNPSIQFKSEIFAVLMVIAWTYLLHAYYRNQGIEYRYFKLAGSKRRFKKTQNGAYKHWELERCLQTNQCPLDKNTKNNLMFLIGLRHEIEHQMTTRIDDLLSAKFQACCINFNDYIKKFFGDSFGIERQLAVSLQFSGPTTTQIEDLKKGMVPSNVAEFINQFEENLPMDEFQDKRYAYRILFVPKGANRKGQADRVVEFVPEESELAMQVNKDYVLIKDREKPKYLPGLS